MVDLTGCFQSWLGPLQAGAGGGPGAQRNVPLLYRVCVGSSLKKSDPGSHQNLWPSGRLCSTDVMAPLSVSSGIAGVVPFVAVTATAIAEAGNAINKLQPDCTEATKLARKLAMLEFICHTIEPRLKKKRYICTGHSPIVMSGLPQAILEELSKC